MSSKGYYGNEVYEAHASPESIAVYLHREQEAAKRIARRIAWLEQLLERRLAEKAAGTWPATPTETDKP